MKLLHPAQAKQCKADHGEDSRCSHGEVRENRRPEGLTHRSRFDTGAHVSTSKTWRRHDEKGTFRAVSIAMAQPVRVTFEGITPVLPAAIRVFDNNDRDIQHNITIIGQDPTKPVFRGQLVTGVATATYKFHSPPAGEYKFQCDVHPAQMKGTVRVV